MYKYSALTKVGKINVGEMYAENEKELQNKLKQNDLELIKARNPYLLQGLRIKKESEQLLFFTRNCARMLQAGIPLIDVITELRSHMDDKCFAQALSVILAAIKSGYSFSSAIKDHSVTFPPPYAAMVEIGELSGTLPAVLRDVEKALIWQRNTAKKIKKAIYYPLFSAVVLIAVTVYLMVYLVPNLTTFILNTGFNLPWYTILLIALSDHISEFIVVYLVSLMCLIFVVYGLTKTSKKIQIWSSHAVLIVPWIGSVILNIKLARLTYTVSKMYGAGINIISALESAKNSLSNVALEKTLENVVERIRQGSTLAESMQLAKFFPPIAYQMLSVGEKSGTIEKSLQQVSEIYQERADQSIERMEQAIGPILTLLVGSILIWVILAVIGPIYDAVFSLGTSL